MSAQEQKNKRIGVLATVVFHGALLLFFLLFMAWTEPDPPIPEYGIEFNLGSSEISDVVSDETESIEEAEEVQDSPDDSEVIEQGTESEQVEEVVEQPVEEVAETTPEEVTSEPIETVDETSPDTREEQPVVEKTEEAVEEEKKDPQPAKTEETETEQSEEPVEEVKKTPEIDERAIMKGDKDSAPSGNQGVSLKMDGWKLEFIEVPDEDSQEFGFVEFDIEIDSNGEVMGVTYKPPSNLSNKLRRLYQDAVFNALFERRGDNRSTAKSFKGTIKFVLKAK